MKLLIYGKSPNAVMSTPTTEPIVLKDYFSQTRAFAWARHNGWEEFLFEPGLEPNISASQLAELGSKDVVQILVADRTGEVFAGHYTPKIEIFLVGANGKFRRTEALEAGGTLLP